MRNAQTLLYDRYSIIHIERTNRFNKVLFVLDTFQNPPRSCVIKIFQPIVENFQIIKWIEGEFVKEAKRLKQMSLRNSYLPQIYTYANHAQEYYLVRELIEGRTIREQVQTRGKFSTTEVREILIKLLSVLDYIHQQGVIHQNIKPKNIVLRNGDRLPMLINFGSIKQIISTYGFYGDKQIFSSNNIYGYAPSELALGRAVPASDLYSLGLIAIYLLTAKNPVDLQTDLISNHFRIPPLIASLDWHLAKIINRAIKSNIGDRYNSAREMLDDLLQSKSESKSSSAEAKQISVSHIQTAKPSSLINIDPQPVHNWWKTIVYVMTSLCIGGTLMFFWYDWNLNQNIFVPLPEPSTSLPSASQPPPQSSSIADPPSMLNNQYQNAIEIPIFVPGTKKQDLRKALGEPNAIQKGYWSNSSAWIYKNQADGSIDLGYLFDLDTDRLRQTEVAIAPSVGLPLIVDILDTLLQGNITPSINQELTKIYNHQAEKYSFHVQDLKVSIEREPDEHIYLGVWEADFH